MKSTPTFSFLEGEIFHLQIYTQRHCQKKKKIAPPKYGQQTVRLRSFSSTYVVQ